MLHTQPVNFGADEALLRLFSGMGWDRCHSCMYVCADCARLTLLSTAHSIIPQHNTTQHMACTRGRGSVCARRGFVRWARHEVAVR